MTGMRKILAEEVRKHGVVSFARFMELALYCPQCGYYERQDAVIGGSGDYYTSVSVGGLFGELLVFQFAEWAEELGIQPLQLVEAGAHGGNLCADILSWLAQERPSLYEVIEYWIVEPSTTRRMWQQAKLEKFAGRIRWVDSISSLLDPGIKGVIFSNELLDAMPVHRLGWDASQKNWFEWGVALEGERFIWQKGDTSREQVDAVLESAHVELSPELTAVLPAGFTLEICPAAAMWWTQAARTLRRGKLLTIDFGFAAEELLMPGREQGTLRAYRRHHASSDLLADPGEQDLTADVNFTQLQHIGEKLGLGTEGLVSQEQFLTRIAQMMWNKEFSCGRWTSKQLRQFQTLTHPEHLGRSFRVLIQGRNVEKSA
jgi:SAM-dependent MidA family methyltransferase